MSAYNMLKKIKCDILKSGSSFWALYLKLRGVKVGKKFTCIGRPGLNRTYGSSIIINDGVTLCNTAIANPIAEGGRCRLATLHPEASLVIGYRAGLSSAVICCASEIIIGDDTIIGGGVMIADTDFHPRMKGGTWGTNPRQVSKPVKIGSKCFIGARSIILKGVSIGDGAIIGAGAVVTKDVDSNTMVAGNPARRLRPTNKA